MKVTSNVFLQLKTDPKWAKKVLSFFAAANAQEQTRIIAAAQVASSIETSHFAAEKLFPPELLFFCENSEVTVPAFLEAMSEHIKLGDPNNAARVLLELNSVVSILHEMKTAIELAKTELQALKRQINAAKRERNNLFRLAEEEGTLQLADVMLGLSLLSPKAIERLNEEKTPEHDVDWYESLPQALTAENLRTAWLALSLGDAEAELKKLMWGPQDARSLLVIAAGMSLHGMDTAERFQERHMELLAEHEAYGKVSMELDIAYGV